MHIQNFCAGQVIIQENDPLEDRLFIILSGLCNLAVMHTSEKFKTLELEDDPSLKKREIEL